MYAFVCCAVSGCVSITGNFDFIVVCVVERGDTVESPKGYHHTPKHCIHSRTTRNGEEYK